MGNLRGSEWLILVLVVILLFGAKKLPEAARGLGRSLRIFKSEVTTKDDPVDDVEVHGSTAVTPQAIAPLPAVPMTAVPTQALPVATPLPAETYVPPATVVQTTPAVADPTSVQSVNEHFYGEERSDR